MTFRGYINPVFSRIIHSAHYRWRERHVYRRLRHFGSSLAHWVGINPARRKRTAGRVGTFPLCRAFFLSRNPGAVLGWVSTLTDGLTRSGLWTHARNLRQLKVLRIVDCD